MAQRQPPPAGRLCLGVVTGPHGVRGAVRVKSFTADPADLGSYGPLSDEAGTRVFTLEVVGMLKGAVIATIQGVNDRDQAEALKGLNLFVDRAQLPAAEEEEFYHADLIGLEAVLADGSPIGRITAVWDFGAGDSLEIAGVSGGTVVVPFTKAVVPVVDLAAGRVVIEPPEGLFDKPEPPAPLADQTRLAAEILGGGGP